MLKPLLAVALTAASSAPSPLLGSWAGDQVTLRVSPEGAVVTLDCASLRIAQPIVVNKAGRFAADAHAARYAPGPQRADEPPPDTLEKVSGVLRGDALTLTMPDARGGTTKYLLHRNRTTKLIRCL